MLQRFAWIALLAMGLAMNAVAQEQKSIDIAAQDLGSALRALASQTGAQIVFAADDLKGLKARPVKGAMTTEEAIRRLLEGTGATFAVASTGTFEIQRAKDETAAVTLESVVVSATRSARTLDDIPASVTVLNREQIQATPAQSLDDVIRTVPGINMPSSASYEQHPTSNAINMRGLGSQFDTRTLVMLDGVPINSAFQGVVQWMQVPMETIDRVEVVRGGGSALWGNYALGGVINIITRPPDTTELALDAGYGQFSTTRINAYGAASGNDAFKLSGNLNYFNTAGYNRVPADQRAPLDVPTSFEAQNAQVVGNFKVDSTLTAYMRGNFFKGDQTLGTPLSTNSTRQGNLAGGVVKKTSDTSTLIFNTFYGDTTFRTDNTGAPEGSEPRTAEYLQNAHDTKARNFGASLQWNTNYSLLFPLLSIGADVQYVNGSDTAAIFDESGTQIRTDLGRGKQLLTGVFGQASMFPVSELEILASVRFEYFRNYDGYDGNPGGIGNVPDMSTTDTTGRISLRYEINPNLAARGAIYSGFRAPSLDSLYRGFSIPGGTFLPNSQLVPEKLQGGEAGFDILGKGFRSQITAFYNQITNLITSRNLDESELPPGFFFGSKNINAGKLRATGVEVAADWVINPRWSANVGYTYTSSVLVDNPLDPGSVGRQLFGVPYNKASATVAYTALSGFKATTRVRYQQGHASDPSYTLFEPTYTVWDLSLSYAFSKQVAVFANIENLFDRVYVADNSGFGPPQLGTPFSLFAGVRLRF